MELKTLPIKPNTEWREIFEVCSVNCDLFLFSFTSKDKAIVIEISIKMY